MESDYPYFADLCLPDQLRLAAFGGEGVLPPGMLDAIQRAADALEALRWAIDASPSGGSSSDIVREVRWLLG